MAIMHNFAVEDEPLPSELRFLEDGLTEFNAEATGIGDGRLLTIMARDEAGSPRGGATGWTWAGICHVRFLFVAPEHRRGGLGTRLMEAVEHEALARACGQIVLETIDFQAPEFYRKLGFEVVATVPDHPPGHRLMIMRRSLGGRSPATK
jgi:GNAT superfamily N-acetyltransferase